jgi:hypothetical protein
MLYSGVPPLPATAGARKRARRRHRTDPRRQRRRDAVRASGIPLVRRLEPVGHRGDGRKQLRVHIAYSLSSARRRFRRPSYSSSIGEGDGCELIEGCNQPGGDSGGVVLMRSLHGPSRWIVTSGAARPVRLASSTAIARHGQRRLRARSPSLPVLQRFWRRDGVFVAPASDDGPVCRDAGSCAAVADVSSAKAAYRYVKRQPHVPPVSMST